MGKRTRRPGVGVDWIITWPLMLVFGAMVFLTTEEIRSPGPGAPQVVAGRDWQKTLPERIASVSAALKATGLPLDLTGKEESGSGNLRWTEEQFALTLPADRREEAEAAFSKLREVDPGVTVSSVPAGRETLIQIGLDGLLTHTVRVHWEDGQGPPRVALVAAGLGDDLGLAREVAQLGAPVALGVRPFRPFSKEVAELGRIFGREVWLDLSGNGGGSTPKSQKGELESALASVPHAIGVIGGGETASGALAEAVRQRGLLYVDAAAPAGAAPSVVAIQPGASADEVGKELDRMARRAREAGAVVGIGPASRDNEEAFGAALESWHSGGLEIVPVSTLAPSVALSAR